MVPPTGAMMRGGAVACPAGYTVGSVPSRDHSGRAGSTPAVNAISLRGIPGGGALGVLSWGRVITASQTNARCSESCATLDGRRHALPERALGLASVIPRSS